MPDLQPYAPFLPYVIATLALLAAFVISVAIFRRLRRGSLSSRGERLAVIESCEVDESRRLVLLRRDNIEHLILLGSNHDLVIESGIGAKHPLDQVLPGIVQNQTQKPEEPVPLRPAPRAPVFGTKRPFLRAVEDRPEDETP